MSEEFEVEKNFRSSYYESLGFRAGEKSLSYLEGLIKADTVDVEKLKSFCLKHTLPAYYRLLVWKIILGVCPPYNDANTCSFVRSQKEQQFQDLKHALQVMGRITQPALYEQSRLICPDDFVLVYLLESNRLLSAAVSQLRQEQQVALSALAQPFLALSEEEGEAYWLFSRFAQRWESQLPLIQTMECHCFQSLEEVDYTLFQHMGAIGTLDHGLPLKRWFHQCFATVLPESCLESVWDKVIAGSAMILVYVAVAILLSLKRRILGLKSSEEVSQLLCKIPEDNFSFIVSKAIELWGSQGCPLVPSDLRRGCDSPVKLN